MSLRWQLLRRTGFTIFAIYLVITITFGFVTLAGDPNQGFIVWQTVSTQGEEAALEALAEYRSARNLNAPLLDRYVGWIVDITTLQWGNSFSQNAPVIAVIKTAIPRTLAYVLPAIVFALTGGIGIGLYSATHERTMLSRLGNGIAYIGLAVPNFWLAGIALFLFTGPFGQYGQATVSNWQLLKTVVFPSLILGTSLLAGQARYARAESIEYVNAEFVKLLRAKGASGWDIARHLLRNTAVPLLSLFFADLILILVFNIYVIEFIFDIQGIGLMSYEAIQDRDLPLVLGTTMVLVFFGIFGNLFQDIAYRVLDPRIGTTESE